MVQLRKLNGMLLCFCILTSVLILIFQMNTHDTYSRMRNREYLTETDIQQTLRCSTEHKIIIYQVLVQKARQIETAQKWQSEILSKHFRQKLSSQNTRNGISEHQDFWGSMPPHPTSGSSLWCLLDLLVMKKHPNWTYSKPWTVWIGHNKINIPEIFQVFTVFLIWQ